MESILTEIEIPQSVMAETAVLGCCLLEPGCIDDAAAELVADDFYELRNRNLFELLVKLRGNGRIVDVITIFQEAKDTLGRGIEDIGGVAYVSSLPEQVPSAAGLPTYAATVAKKSKLRSLVHTAQSVLSIATNKGDDDDLLDEAHGKLLNLLATERESGLIPLKDVVRDALADIEEAFTNKGKVLGIPTGFPSLDGITMGLKDGDMIVLAGRPSQGKTSLALTIAEHVAIDNGISTGFLSMEMTSRALVKRIISARAGVDSHHMGGGRLGQSEITQITSTAAEIVKAPLYIDQTGNLSIVQLQSKARHLKYRYGIKFLVIDYLQLMHAKADSRVQEVTKISAAIKLVARELNIPVMVLSQLSRKVEEQSREPALSDLRDSGAIEQDADLVALMCRDKNSNRVWVNIAKHRNGPCGRAKLEFIPHLTRFQSPRYEVDTT